jgi:hypothetical protein
MVLWGSRHGSDHVDKHIHKHSARTHLAWSYHSTQRGVTQLKFHEFVDQPAEQHQEIPHLLGAGL